MFHVEQADPFQKPELAVLCSPASLRLDGRCNRHWRLVRREGSPPSWAMFHMKQGDKGVSPQQ